METLKKKIITVETTIDAPVEKVWEYWTKPEHITQWNNASDDWHTPFAENDVQAGGRFICRMEAKDNTMGFDFIGTYDAIRMNEYIEYTLEDGRNVKISFSSHENSTTIVESFEAENANPVEMQQGGWQAILNNFKKYTEAGY